MLVTVPFQWKPRNPTFHYNQKFYDLLQAIQCWLYPAKPVSVNAVLNDIKARGVLAAHLSVDLMVFLSVRNF